MKIKSASFTAVCACVLTAQIGLGLQAQDTSPPAVVAPPGFFTNIIHAHNTNEVVEVAAIPDYKDSKDIVKIGGDVILKADQTSRDVVVVLGSATIDGIVDGDLVVVLGSATVNGRVRGDMVVVLGSVQLGPNAELLHDATVVGGALTADPAARIVGKRVEINDANMPGMSLAVGWIKQGLFLARPLPPKLGWVWIVAGALLLLNLLLVLMFQHPIKAAINEVELSPIASFFSGILFLILFGPLLILLAPTILGAPLLLLFVLVASLIGKVAVYCFAGRQLLRPLSASFAQSVLFSAMVGTLLFYLLYMVPLLGFVAWGVVGVWGIGAVLMAAFRGFRREREKAISVPGAAGGVMENFFVPPAIGSEASFIRAGFWFRTCAVMLDLALFMVVIVCLAKLGFVIGRMFLALWCVYHVGMWTWNGTTIGGIVMGIKIVRTDGRPITFAVALVRFLSSLFSAMVIFLGFFWAGWSRERQSWHDKIAGTIVVKLPKGMSLV